MNAHVSNIARTCYFELRRLLTSTATATLVSAFALSRIDYCNSHLFGSTHDVTYHLQAKGCLFICKFVSRFFIYLFIYLVLGLHYNLQY